MEIKSNKKRIIEFVVPSILFVVLAIACNNSDETLRRGVVFASMGYALFAPFDDLFCYLVGLSIYDFSFNLDGVNASAYITLIFLVRLFIKNNFKNNMKLKTSGSMFIAAAIIIVCELFGDMSFQRGDFLLAMINALFLVFVGIDMGIDLNPRRTIYLYSFAYMTAIWTILYTYGGLSGFLGGAFTNDSLFRLGIDKGNVQGGAMSLPIYALLLLSFTIVYFINEKKVKLLDKIILITLNVISVAVTVLTFSKSFYFGLAVVLLILLIGAEKKNRKIFFGIIGVLTVGIILIATIYPDVLASVWNYIMRRFSVSNIGTGRFETWDVVFDFQLNHPLSLLFGSGAARYPSLDSNLYIGAHNLILDIFMSWGIFGVVAVVLIVVRAYSSIYRKGKTSLILPFWSYVAFAMTALRSNSLKTWSFLLITLLFVKCYSDRKFTE